MGRAIIPILSECFTTFQKPCYLDNGGAFLFEMEEEVNFAFDEFLKMRKKIRKPPTEYAITLLKKKLHKLSDGLDSIKIEILNQSIVNSWQDLYPLKTDNQKLIGPKAKVTISEMLKRYS